MVIAGFHRGQSIALRHHNPFLFSFFLLVWRGCVDCVVLAMQTPEACKSMSSESNDEFAMKLLSKCRCGPCANIGILQLPYLGAALWEGKKILGYSARIYRTIFVRTSRSSSGILKCGSVTQYFGI